MYINVPYPRPMACNYYGGTIITLTVSGIRNGQSNVLGKGPLYQSERLICNYLTSIYLALSDSGQKERQVPNDKPAIKGISAGRVQHGPRGRGLLPWRRMLDLN